MLAIGLSAGATVAFVLARRSPARVAERTADLELRLNDLRLRKAELYERLRSAEELPHDEQARLERSAARVLRDLDRLEAEHAAATPKPKGKRVKRGKADPKAAAGAPAPAVRHPLLVGFAMGAGMVGLVAVLIFYAQGDAQPKPEEPVMAAGGGAAPFDRGEPELPPAVKSQVEELRSRVDGEPNNLDLRKQLADVLLAHGHFFGAFEQGQGILAIDPADPDGHYIAGIVRMTMGQAEPAVDHLRQTLDVRPDHAAAAMMHGLLLLQLGDREAAIASWRRAVEAHGGSHPGLEHVLRLAEEGRSAQEILSTPPP